MAISVNVLIEQPGRSGAKMMQVSGAEEFRLARTHSSDQGRGRERNPSHKCGQAREQQTIVQQAAHCSGSPRFGSARRQAPPFVAPL
jgi:hypothetical protein